MQGALRKSAARMPPAGTKAAATLAGTLRFFCLLWLAGLAMRMTLLVVPPVIPLIHEDLRMSETQIGLLIGLPLALFAIAAVPGSLLVARGGAKLAVTLGMVIAAFAGGLRGAAFDVWTLYAAAIATGFGIAIMQPGMPKLVHDWLPNRIGIATVVYSNGMVIGAILPPVLTIPFVLPLVGGSWRLNFFVWAAPAILITIVFLLLSPKETHRSRAAPAAIGALWWPDWRNPLIWLLGFTFGRNNSPFFAANAFLGDYLASRGQADLLGPALASLNGAQLVALVRGRRPPAAARMAVSAVRSGDAGGLSRADLDQGSARHPCQHRIDRHQHGDDHDADSGIAAASGRARGRSAHRRRHAHHQLYLRDRHSDALWYAVGHDRQALDRVRAALPVRRRADGAGLDREPAQTGRSCRA